MDGWVVARHFSGHGGVSPTRGARRHVRTRLAGISVSRGCGKCEAITCKNKKQICAPRAFMQRHTVSKESLEACISHSPSIHRPLLSSRTVRATHGTHCACIPCVAFPPLAECVSSAFRHSSPIEEVWAERECAQQAGKGKGGDGARDEGEDWTAQAKYMKMFKSSHTRSFAITLTLALIHTNAAVSGHTTPQLSPRHATPGQARLATPCRTSRRHDSARHNTTQEDTIRHDTARQTSNDTLQRPDAEPTTTSSPAVRATQL